MKIGYSITFKYNYQREAAKQEKKKTAYDYYSIISG